MSDGKLFQTLVAAAAKVLSLKQLDVPWTVSVSGMQLSGANVGDQLAIIGKIARGMTGQGPTDERRCLEHKCAV